MTLLPDAVEDAVRVFNAVVATLVGAALLTMAVWLIRHKKISAKDLLFLHGVGGVLLGIAYGSAEAAFMPELGARVLIIAVGLIWLAAAIAADVRDQWKGRKR